MDAPDRHNGQTDKKHVNIYCECILLLNVTAVSRSFYRTYSKSRTFFSGKTVLRAFGTLKDVQRTQVVLTVRSNWKHSVPTLRFGENS